MFQPKKITPMKKTLLLIGICCIVYVCNAQQSKEVAAFYAYSSSLDSSRHAASHAKDYPKAIALVNEWLGRYDQLPKSLQPNYSGYRQNMYYNLACYQNLTGQKADAINNLQKAFAAGFIDFNFILNDSDLASLHDDAGFKAFIMQVREKVDFAYILQNSGPYKTNADNTLPSFTYQDASAPELVALKNKFNLDSLSGNGNEISKFKNLLFWVHNQVRHDGNSNNPKLVNAVDLIAVCKTENRGVNCRMMATILRDVYQAEGFKTRIVTCMPKDTLDNDCHVITVVWSHSLNKWLWMDPTFNAYMRDENGNYLNIEEVRERLVNGKPLVLNEDANWNKMKKSPLSRALPNGGHERFRTSDPYSVNVVLSP